MRLKITVVAALVVATLAVYWQCAGHDFIILDDQLYVTKNAAIQGGISWEGITWAFSPASTETSGNWHPVTWISHMLDIEIFGLNPAGHHLVNVSLHALNAALLFLVLRGMSGALWRSAMVAALFALHPLHVESVAWVAERKDVLSTLFWMLTLLLYASYLKRPGALRYLATLACFALGLMAKPMLVTLPLVLLCLDFWPLGRWQGATGVPDGAPPGEASPAPACGKDLPGLLLEKLPFFVLTAIFCAVAIYAQHQGGYVPDLSAFPLRLRLYNALLAYRDYLANAFWPHDLAVHYPFPGVHSILPAAGSLLLLGGLSLAAALKWRRHPYLAVGWLWFLITLVPVIGLIQVGRQSMADRYMYIPLIGLCIAVVWGIPALLPAPARRPALLAAAAGAALLAFSALSWQQLGHWRDSKSLLEHSIAVTGPNYFAHFLLGNALFQQGRYQEALPHYQAAVRVDPAYEPAHYKIGLISMMNGDLQGAIRHLSITLTLAPNSERSGNARVSLERCLAIQRSGSHKTSPL
ncbi:MAG TPA: hypothetical protein DDY22_05995 [Geobacter sp.]|nr:hypothetical protein [Geobacter sp.]